MRMKHLDSCYCPRCWPEDTVKTGPNLNSTLNHEYRYDPIKLGVTMETKAINQEKSDTIRGQILDAAKSLTTGDRNKTYGPPIGNLTVYAGLMQAYVEGRAKVYGGVFDAVDASIFMVLAKISRIAANRGHKDNYIDGAAYMAIAGECDSILTQEKGKADLPLKEAEIIVGGGFS